MSERPAIIRIQETPSGDITRVVITLSWQDAEYAGEATGRSDPALRPRLVGEATLRAVEGVADNRVHLRLGAVATTDLGGTQVAMAQVSMEGAPAPFVGSAILEDRDASAATVKAVLDALNRQLARVLA